MDINTLLIYGVFTLIGIVLFLNVIKVFSNILSTPKKVVSKEELEEAALVSDLRLEIDEQVKPHLTSLEGMYKKSNSTAATLGSFVFSIFKDKLSTYVEKDEKMVEEEICKCCSDYEGAECKESFCLEGSGLSCPKE
ncbi:MAG: Unknown protein [uncultured Sulfurovum sp.]|uniref:Uncharacterized protein n=1 Tax=uncultured Sulfurovum sp. TaxID=269237 RepID=A0A6S6S7D4_9BACT|nr:MAG: Unknown protein [uncultured Sulfurovum sp.]